jgi:hypothetical protein
VGSPVARLLVPPVAVPGRVSPSLEQHHVTLQIERRVDHQIPGLQVDLREDRGTGGQVHRVQAGARQSQSHGHVAGAVTAVPAEQFTRSVARPVRDRPSRPRRQPRPRSREYRGKVSTRASGSVRTGRDRRASAHALLKVIQNCSRIAGNYIRYAVSRVVLPLMVMVRGPGDPDGLLGVREGDSAGSVQGDGLDDRVNPACEVGEGQDRLVVQLPRARRRVHLHLGRVAARR